ncbi:MAG: nitroreductase family protein [Deltaproteobacteria bacterium]|nr:nitroreductase family protein [Deltaproteobacteria bacterium]
MDLAATDELLTRTRSVRKRLDLSRPVPRALIAECIEIALQAPTGSNAQGWHFVVVTDAAKRAEIARAYKETLSGYLKLQESAGPRWKTPGDPRAAQEARVRESALYLGDHLHEVPVHVIPCVEGRVENAGLMAQASLYGSILPAAWSFMLAARARGLGMAWTTLHLAHEAAISKLLGIPPTVTQTALLPVAFFKGRDFKRATRVPGRDLTSWDSWGARG